MRRVVCPGSFDPVTHGHLDVIGRAAVLFDEVVVSVGTNSAKTGLFTVEERTAMMRAACADWANVRIDTFSGLLVDHCREVGATGVVKGLRTGGDFEYELSMAHMNTELSGLETVFLPTSARWSHVSSTLIREIAALGGEVSGFLPADVAQRTVERARQRTGGQRSQG